MRLSDALETALPLIFVLAVVIFVALIGFISVGHTAEHCVASVYGTHDRDQNGTKTASGIPLRDDLKTLAHRRIEFGVHVIVTNKRNGRSAEAPVVDRGPYRHRERCVDLSHALARAINCRGLCPVKVEIVKQ